MKTPKWLKWEFLPWQYFYIPLYFYYLLLSAREGSMGWISAVNPNLPLGGLADTSKTSLLKHFPPELVPKGFLISRAITISELEEKLSQYKIDFPLIAKPDRMERGRGVALIRNSDDLAHYHQKNKYEYLIQEYINFPVELGILYYKIPGENRGRITSIVQKGFLKVVGDGKSTLKELIDLHPRTFYFKTLIANTWKSKMSTVPGNLEEVLLEPIGNHNRGTTFYNANFMINNRLCAVFDTICSYVPEFYCGRFDIRVPSVEDLYAGINIKIIELNGSNSEPAHIYDPSYKLLSAYRDLFKHWNTMFKIARINHNASGFKYDSAAAAYKILRLAERNRDELRVPAKKSPTFL